MSRIRVEEAEAVLDEQFPVLDKGFVRLVDYMGGDQRIVQSARVSYGAGTKSFRKDRGLIRYLLRNEHTSPFEQVELTFHTKMPIFVARQWVRHRTANLNEISGRYSVLKDEFYLPDPQYIAVQSTDNKQGRSLEPVPNEVQQLVTETLEGGQREAYRAYESLLDQGIARELARINLPVSLYTEWYWKIDLHNLFRFLALRMDDHAQYEIREYARTMFELAKRVCPIACEAFEDFMLGSRRFSRLELEALREMAATLDVLDFGERAGLRGKELERFKEKLEKN
jgi:thymidylate synthase (FAD)